MSKKPKLTSPADLAKIAKKTKPKQEKEKPKRRAKKEKTVDIVQVGPPPKTVTAWPDWPASQAPNPQRRRLYQAGADLSMCNYYGINWTSQMAVDMAEVRGVRPLGTVACEITLDGQSWHIINVKYDVFFKDWQAFVT